MTSAETNAQNRIMAEALSDPRPVSVVAVDGAAVDNVRSNADQIQVPFRFFFRCVMRVTGETAEIFKREDTIDDVKFFLFKKGGFLSHISSHVT